MQTDFLQIWDEVEKSVWAVERECTRLGDAGLDLEVLKGFKRFDSDAYDMLEDYGNESLLKFAQDYRTAASGFNKLLDEKIAYARRFVVKQDKETQRVLEQRVRDVERQARNARNRADREASKRSEFEKRAESAVRNNSALKSQYNGLLAEKRIIERGLADAEKKTKKLEQHVSNHGDIKKTQEEFAEQIGIINARFESYSGNSDEAYRRIEGQLQELQKEFGIYVKKQGEEQQKHQKQLEHEINVLEETLGDYEKRIKEYEKTSKIKQECFSITEDYVNSVEPPDTPEYKAFGNALVESSCWTDNLYELRKELGRMWGMTVNDGDKPYLKHLINGLYQSLDSGELGKIADMSPDKMEEILETIDLFNDFIGQKQAA